MNYISKKEKRSFYTGLAGQNVVYSLIGGSFFTYFMTDVASFNPLAVSAILFVMKLWDGINDPIVGSIVDRHRFKSGEKLRPLLRYTPVPVGIFTFLIFVVFKGWPEALRVTYFIIMYICWDIVYTLQDVAIWGITATVSPDSNERDRFIQGARTIGSCFYGVFSMGIPMIIEMVANATGSTLATMTMVFAAIFGLGGALVSYKTYAAQERIRVVAPEAQQTSIIECFKLLFQNKMLMLITLSNLFGALGFGTQLTVYFFKYKIPADFLGADSIIGALGLTTIYSAITYAPGFIGMLFADKFKKLFKGHRNFLIFMQLCNIVTRIIAFLIGFEGKNLWIGMIIMGIGCIPNGAAGIAQTSLFCDSIDYMEWKTGKRTEGVTFSMQTFFTKISSGITQSLATLALSILGYVNIPDAPGAIYTGTQSAAFENWIWPLFMLTPAIASVLYIIPLLKIKYTPAQKAQVEAELAERRAMQEATAE